MITGKTLEVCACCKNGMFHTDKFVKIDGKFYCEDCIDDSGYLDEEDYDDCDYDAMPGGYDDV